MIPQAIDHIMSRIKEIYRQFIVQRSILVQTRQLNDIIDQLYHSAGLFPNIFTEGFHIVWFHDTFRHHI